VIHMLWPNLLKIGSWKIDRVASGLLDMKNLAIPESYKPTILPSLSLSCLKFCECCHPLRSVTVPNLVQIGYGLLELILKN